MTNTIKEGLSITRKLLDNQNYDENSSSEIVKHTIVFKPEEIISIFGPAEENLHIFTDHCEVHIGIRGNEISIIGTGRKIRDTQHLLNSLRSLASLGSVLTRDDIYRAMRVENDLLSQESGDTSSISTDILVRKGKMVRPKTLGQRRYIEAIDSHDIVFGIGPAGTGKSFLAVAMAVAALQKKQVRRIILTRPAVEAGERLGFLPGSVSEKIDPYLRPLLDALCDLLDPDSVTKLLAAGVIEVAPLAYMRGRTLNDAFVILDEAQNTSIEQMKMFLTRLGVYSKMVVTGDLSQIDLKDQVSGLLSAKQVLSDVDGIFFAELTSCDVVRHRLVGAIIDAYFRSGQDNKHKDKK